MWESVRSAGNPRSPPLFCWPCASGEALSVQRPLCIAAAVVGSTSIMVNFVPISAERHTGKAWRRPAGFTFAAEQTLVPLTSVEFAKVAVVMPMAFVLQDGVHLPVGVMSPIAGRNLFIGPSGQWLGAYVPAALRSYPFRLALIPNSEQVTLCIDEDTGLLMDADGVAEEFVDIEGNPLPTTKALLDFLLAIERGRAGTELAVTALANADLLRPWTFEVTVEGRLVRSTGLLRVDEGALNALDDTTFLTLRRAGALSLAHLQLLSMNQIAVFDQLNRLQQRLAQAHQPQQHITSLDELFAQASSETLRFN